MSSLDDLRRAGDIAVEDPVYTTALLEALLATASVNGAALTIWRERAGAYAKLVSVSEGGSSRQMSDLYAHARDMIKLYQGLVDGEGPDGPDAGDMAPYTIQIERP